MHQHHSLKKADGCRDSGTRASPAVGPVSVCSLLRGRTRSQPKQRISIVCGPSLGPGVRKRGVGWGGGGTWYQEGQEDAHTQKPHLAAAHASVCLHPMCICVRASENRACSERSPVWNRTPSWARSLRPDNLSARLCRWLGLIGDPRCGQLGSLT